MKQFLKILIPDFLITIYKKLKSNKRAAQRNRLAKSGSVVLEKDILYALTAAGIKSGDSVMVHSSLSKIGYLEGGANTLISALQKVVEPDGNLLMPAFPAVGFNFDYLKTNPLFDLKLTPSKMGIVTEVFRNLPGVKRSLHPTDSVCVMGKDANYFVNEHFGQLTPYNEHSPFMKLVKRNGKILLIGVKLESVTNFHTPEDAILNFKYPVYHEKIFTTRLKDENGKSVNMMTKVHNPVFSKKRKCNDFEEVFLAKGIMSRFKMGLADCKLIDAAKMHNWLVDNYKNGITMYTPNGKE